MPLSGAEKSKLRRVQHLKLTDSLKSVPCVDCGNVFPPECMDMDHRDPSVKKFIIAHAATRSMSALLEEIAKCDIICANCHRVRTRKRLTKNTQ